MQENQFTREELNLLLAVVNECVFKGQVAELVVEIKRKIKSNLQQHNSM